MRWWSDERDKVGEIMVVCECGFGVLPPKEMEERSGRVFLLRCG